MVATGCLRSGFGQGRPRRIRKVMKGKRGSRRVAGVRTSQGGLWGRDGGRRLARRVQKRVDAGRRTAMTKTLILCLVEIGPTLTRISPIFIPLPRPSFPSPVWCWAALVPALVKGRAVPAPAIASASNSCYCRTQMLHPLPLSSLVAVLPFEWYQQRNPCTTKEGNFFIVFCSRRQTLQFGGMKLQS